MLKGRWVRPLAHNALAALCSLGIESINVKFKTKFKMEDKVQVSNSAQIAQNCLLTPVVWGVNKFGQEVKEHDKLSCGNGHDTWFTHVMFDTERNCWHREQDYYHSKVVGSYNGC